VAAGQVVTVSWLFSVPVMPKRFRSAGEPI